MNDSKFIQALQFLSIGAMWLFGVSITVWVIHLGVVAHELADAFNASIGITVVALPVYWAIASVLTYTFFGLRRGARGAGRGSGATSADPTS